MQAVMGGIAWRVGVQAATQFKHTVSDCLLPSLAFNDRLAAEQGVRRQTG